MLNNKDIFEQSLVNHLYFAGTIRSFCTTIGLTFFKNNQDYIDRAIKIGYQATDITNKTISYMNNTIANEVLKNEVYITKYTKDIDLLTEKLFDINLKMQINEDEDILKTRKEVNYDEVIDKITELNNEGLILVNDFNNFVEEIKIKLDNQELFSYLYPDFFNYMYEEVSVYERDLKRIQSGKDYTSFYVQEFRYYFNELLRKSAEYIRGFLDTSYQDIFDMSSFYVNAFSDLTEKYLKDNNTSLYDETERLVINYKSFVTNVIERLLRSELSFITPPVVLDNFLTNINVYIFILKYARTIN